MKYFVLSLLLVACTTHSGNGDDAGAGDDAAGSGSGSSSVSELRFAIVGDTRPPAPNDTTNYPTAIITKIYADIQGLSPRPEFAVSTGDYMFADPSNSSVVPQLTKYMGARGGFTGTLYPAMGNHECTGATDSNCGAGSKDGITSNMSNFISMMLTPIGISSPYYTENINASDGSWTAKFVFVACNAWNATQSAWLTSELAKPTTYTFVVRHEGVSALSGTPCSASQQIITAHPLTLTIVGHTHTYAHYASDKEVVVGFGGAPLTSGTNYGYVIVTRNASGTLTVTAYDYQSQAALDTFTIQASGASA